MCWDQRRSKLVPIIDNSMEAAVDELTRIRLEAAAFRGLVAHLRQRTDVQNIDIMNLAGFCRNCLSKWYKAAADEQGVPITREEALEAVYGMSYKEWKSRYQKEATPDQLELFEQTKPLHAVISGHQ